MQFDPDLLKGLVNNKDNEKFAFDEKQNEWVESMQFVEHNFVAQEKICPDEMTHIRPQIYNAELAKKAKTTSKVVTGVLALGAVGAITVSAGLFAPTSDYTASLDVYATQNEIYYQSVVDNWDDNADLCVVVYNGNKQIYRVEKIDSATDMGVQADLPKGVYFTVEIKDGNATLAKQKIKTATHVAKEQR